MSQFVRVIVYLKPYRLEGVKAAVSALDVSGITVQDVRGRGTSEEAARVVGGQTLSVSLPVRSKLTVVVPAERQEEVIATILEHAHTGEANDGKIFVEPVADAIRIRTGERGEAAI
ncbi:MAG: P-II family nitrogen regulator [Chthonomonas sp.]|nr:P-II family nitrogen regulator [Chthonomonas sp.]